MTVGKRLFIAAAILICLGASAAYYVVFLFLTSPESPYRHLLPWLGAALVLAASTLLAMEIWRRYARAVRQLKQQLRTLAANNAIGLLMLDEPTATLAPKIASQILGKIVELREEMDVGILLVEQNAKRALEVSDRAVLLVAGREVFNGRAEDLLSNSDLAKMYLGVT